ncbi:GNAT family N-acetyltransferase [Flavobacterium sp.]|uniref:GNAT family N-acetyltransferase n=1 Tax=Flavobacterium sp. TaxID=239 RepID=UPI0025FD425E|nr:GNAT family N-acetyltransferase [Flavobacterium sp.]
MTFERTTSDNKNFLSLVALLDEDLAIRDGEDHAFYAQFDTLDHIKNVVVGYQDNYVVGCGAFKPYNKTTAEIKRMFVRPNFRGQGIAKGILSALENWASEYGFTNCILETGTNNPQAIQLYTKMGYSIIPNYDQYENVVTSVCLGKIIP